MRQEASTVFLAKVFNWMAAGLALTGGAAYLTANTPLARFVLGTPLVFVLLIAVFGLPLYLQFRIDRLAASRATGFFLAYSVAMGMLLSSVFLVYTAASITATFFITSGMFGAMAVYGLVTKRDLSGMGSFMFMGLVGIILASVVNFFLHSPALHWTISVIGVFVFVGLTAYDVQRIKQIGEAGIMAQGEAAIRKGAIIGALALYLDFVNLFLMLLRFVGVTRD
ncbi:MAG: Bax inhibitor-1/YccA family protein [Desulfobulbaceae bacterium]